MKKLISIALISLLGLVSSLAQPNRPNRFTTNSDPGAWVFLPMPALTAYANGTNYGFDWTTNSYRLQGTGDICFQWSTNWGLMGTNRFATVYIPPTNTFRRIFFANLATNWHNQTRPIAGVPTGYGATIKFNSFGSGETNVVYVPDIDAVATSTNWQGQFLPSSVGGLVLWLEASQQIYEDNYSNSPASDGSIVRWISDLSGTSTKGLTNAATTTSVYYRAPNSSPGNIPSLNFQPLGSAYLVSATFANLTQPNTCFMMFRGRGKSLVFLDGLSEGNRFACFPSESPDYPVQIYSGSSFNLTSTDKSIEWRLFTFTQNSTSSTIRTNGVLAATGNSGTQTPSRWAVGSDYNLGTYAGDPAWLAEMLIYHGSLTAVNTTNIEAYLWNKYGTKHP